METLPAKPVDHARQNMVGNKLMRDLDRYLANYRTADQKNLTEGEVIVALGFLLGLKTQSTEKVQAWLMQIGVAGLDAARTHEEKKKENP